MTDIDEDGLLQVLSAGHSMDYSVWPALLLRLIARIEKIAHQEFPIPNLPPPPPPPPLPLSSTATIPSSISRAPGSDLSDSFLAPLPSSPTDPNLSGSSSDANKENKENKESNPIEPRPTTEPHLAATEPPANPVPAPLSPDTLPLQLASMLSDITSYLQSTFPTYPPHTIQRISELVTNPKRHYRSLTTYLHALDRVVRVTSGLNVYPLPSTFAEVPGALANGVLESSSRTGPRVSPGSDEALGGALLTPIPWIQHDRRSITGSLPLPAQLAQAQQAQSSASTPTQEVPAELEGEVRTESTERIDGPNGVGSIETVSVSVNGIPSMGARGVSVTQGELLRQEQEAGLVPVSQLVPSHQIHSGSNPGIAAQQQIQARIHQQRALAQSQNQARVPSPAESLNSPNSASNTASTSSSATLEGESVAADADNIVGAIGSVHSNNAEDERPHARGPEEIGVDDLGPQTATASAFSISTTTGNLRQGIDVQAAVGRAPLETSASSKGEEDAKDNGADDNKMDIDEDKAGARALTPKREAEDELEGAVTKKLKDESTPAPAESDSKANEGEPESKESDHGDAMDKD
ncbi:hypothetical protein F5Y14DRAFT_409731 [Nemania sp. NC0429]|nr:hypothetical protein F5Y14DRAFT_409731 [Nemania sp. NC0429]